jgi:hypothetical protein
MSVTTFEDFYNLLKDNIVYFQYEKGGTLGTLNIKGTLNRELIPDGDEHLKKYDASIFYSNFHLGLWEGTDSDRSIIITHMNESNMTIPQWLKVYSTNYEMWINIEISKILSLEVVDS